VLIRFFVADLGVSFPYHLPPIFYRRLLLFFCRSFASFFAWIMRCQLGRTPHNGGQAFCRSCVSRLPRETSDRCTHPFLFFFHEVSRIPLCPLTERVRSHHQGARHASSARFRRVAATYACHASSTSVVPVRPSRPCSSLVPIWVRVHLYKKREKKRKNSD
jgi:hypothetical protein